MTARGIRCHYSASLAKKVRRIALNKGLRFYNKIDGDVWIAFMKPISDGTPPYVATLCRMNHKNINDSIKVPVSTLVETLEKLPDVKEK